VTLPQKRRRRVEILIDTRMLGFLRPTPVSGAMPAKRKRDSLEFLRPTYPNPSVIDQANDRAS
jgi:hypothetical protein